jgi:hypothetical protein
VNRFVADERPGVAHFAELFGTDEAEHQAAASLSGEERKNFLRDLYMRQLHDVGDFTYVRSFELMDVERGRTAYFLMFGTRHHKGLEVIKDSMQGRRAASLRRSRKTAFWLGKLSGTGRGVTEREGHGRSWSLVANTASSEQRSRFWCPTGTPNWNWPKGVERPLYVGAGKRLSG